MSSNTPLAIEVKSVSKLFRKQNQRTFKELIPALLGGGTASDTFWALRNLNFSVKKGETLGVIGANGSGKSTLLKLIAGVSKPTKGAISVNGKIAPLIELGAGFHPELTGRENVYLNGIILGMARKAVTEKLKDIVDFAELWDFIDQPVKHYSSGMYLRLAFAVAVHTDPDILLVDEILAVGDSKFQQKCLRRIKSMIKEGKTLIIVSHDLSLVEKYCDKVIVLEKGVEVFSGNSTDAVVALNQNFFQLQNPVLPGAYSSSVRKEWGDKLATITRVILKKGSGEETKSFLSSDDLYLEMTFDNPKELSPLYFSVGIYRDDDIYISGVSTYFDKKPILKEKEGTICLKLTPLTLNKAEYYLRICLFSDQEDAPHHFLHQPFFFSVREEDMKSRGAVNLQHSWSISK